MKLHEHDKYNGTLRARKSFFAVGNRIVCLDLFDELRRYRVLLFAVPEGADDLRRHRSRDVRQGNLSPR
mgnify:CR=1 FL=1